MRMYGVIVTLVVFVVCDTTDEVKLKNLQDDFREWRLKAVPESATSLQIYRYNDRLNSFDYQTFNDTKKRVDDYLVQLNGIRYDQLSYMNKNNYDIFKDVLQTVVDGYPWRMYSALNPVDSILGPQVALSYMVKETPFDTIGDFENFLARIVAYPNKLKEMINQMEEAIRQGHTNHKVSVKSVPEQIDDILTETPEQFVLYSPFNDTLENVTSISPMAKTVLRGKASDSIQKVMSSFKELKHFIRTIYIKYTRPDYGVSSWDNGKKFYKACLKWHLSTEMSPEDVHQIGINEVNRIQKKMKKLMGRLKFTGTVKQFFDSLKNDSRFYGKSKTEVLDSFNTIIHKRIQPKIRDFFLHKNQPVTPIKVEEMTYDGPGGMYIPGTTDGSRSGVFSLNLVRANKMLAVDFPALSLHEASPGHHLQISYAQRARIPKYRSDYLFPGFFQVPFSFPGYTAYTEGWALYTEALGEEMNIYQNDYELMGRYGSEIFRACRLVLDTGLHYYNWTRERAIEYMSKYTTYNLENVKNEIDRYITWPGQACAYKIGELKIKEFRRKAEEELGSRFDLKKFHSIILNDGAMSLSMLERFINKWIEDVKNSVNTGQNGCSNVAEGSRDCLSLFFIFINYVIFNLIIIV